MVIYTRPTAAGSTYDPVVSVYPDGCGTALGCFNSSGPGAIERVLIQGLTAGVTYSYSVSHAGVLGTASTDEFETGVRGFNNASLDPAYCGGPYSLQDAIYATRDDLGNMYANPGVPVRQYGFKFEEIGGPFTVEITQPLYIPYIQLDDVPGLEYGKSYNVSVRHSVRDFVNGVLQDHFSDYNVSCIVGLEGAIPQTQLRPEFCPAPEDLYLNQQIQAIPVIGADQYRFQFVGGGQTLVEQTNNYAVSLHNVGSIGQSLQYGGSYVVRVASRVQGVWSVYGPPCTIGMETQPAEIGIVDSYCGPTAVYDFPYSDFILAELVNGATQYQFRFTPATAGQPTLTEMRSGISFFFHTTNLDFSQGGTFQVDVRAFAGGQWGDYGDACEIQVNPLAGAGAPPTGDLAADKELSSSDISIGLYPNPNAGEEVMVNLSDLDDQSQVISIEVVDLAGKTIYTDQFANKGATANIIVDFDQPLAKGMYFVNVFANDRMITEKLTVE